MDQLDRDRVPRGTVKQLPSWLKIANEKEIECDFATITEVELGNVFDKCTWIFVKEWRCVLEKQSVRFSYHSLPSHAGPCIDQQRSMMRRVQTRRVCKNVFSTFLLPWQPRMSLLDMHPQVQRAQVCNKFGRCFSWKCLRQGLHCTQEARKAEPVSCWLKLAAEVCSRCSPQLCWFACGNDNTNASYSGRTALHPGPRRCAPRAGIWRSCPHTRVVLSTYK